MKKNIEKVFEDEKNKRKLSSEIKTKITYRAVTNAAMNISICILVFAFYIASSFLEKSFAVLIYKISAAIFTLFTIVVWEIAYKKDNDKLALYGIEIFFIAILCLFSQTIFYKSSKNLIYIIIAIETLYYIIKIIRISCCESKKYIENVSDISEIIKKESQDELAKKELEKQYEIVKNARVKEKEYKKRIQEENEKTVITTKKENEKKNNKKTVNKKTKSKTTKTTKKEEPKSKKKKVTTETDIKDKKTKEEENKNSIAQDVPKKKRGRPRKIKES